MEDLTIEALVNEIKVGMGIGDHVLYTLTYGTSRFSFSAPDAETDDDLADILEEAAAFLRAEKREIKFEEELDPHYRDDEIGDKNYKTQIQSSFNG